MPALFANNASGVLASGINDSATSIVLESGQGALFPSPSGGDYFYATLVGLTSGIETSWEIVKCTTRSADTLTIVRAQEGTPAAAWGAATKIELRLTALGIAGKIGNPMTTAGDIIIGGTSGDPARLAKGTALQVLRMNADATAQEYADPAGGGGVGFAINIQTITADKTLTASDPTVQSLTPQYGSGTGNRKVFLPAAPAADIDFVIVHGGTYDNSYYLQVAVEGDTNYFTRLYAGADARFCFDLAGGQWTCIGPGWQVARTSANTYSNASYNYSAGFNANGSNFGTAVGYAAVGNGGVATGYNANGSDGTAVGQNANGANGGVAVGKNTIGPGGIAVGQGATNGSSDGTAVGLNANGSNSGTVIGKQAIGRSNSFAGGGGANADIYSVACGYNASATWRAVAAGYSANGGANGGIAVGYYSNANNEGVAIGYYAYSSTFGVALGYYSRQERYGGFARSGDHAATSKAHVEEVQWKASTSDAAQTEMYLHDVSSRCTILASSVVGFTVRVVGIASGSFLTYDCEIKGTIKRDNANTTTLVGVTKTVINDESGGVWDVIVQANDIAEALVVKVTGAAATAISWGAMATLLDRRI